MPFCSSGDIFTLASVVTAHAQAGRTKKQRVTHSSRAPETARRCFAKRGGWMEERLRVCSCASVQCLQTLQLFPSPSRATSECPAAAVFNPETPSFCLPHARVLDLAALFLLLRGARHRRIPHVLMRGGDLRDVRSCGHVLDLF